jgi:hypothetical protein
MSRKSEWTPRFQTLVFFKLKTGDLRVQTYEPSLGLHIQFIQIYFQTNIPGEFSVFYVLVVDLHIFRLQNSYHLAKFKYSSHLDNMFIQIKSC